MRASVAALAALLVLPTALALAPGSISPEVATTATLEPPQAEVDVVPLPCLPLDVPVLVDECGDTMTGTLVMQAPINMGGNPIQFAGGDLTGNTALAYGGTPVCLAGSTTSGCISGVSAGFGLLGGGSAGAVTLSLDPAVVWLTGGNTGTNPATQFVGTIDNKPLQLRTANKAGLRLEPGPDVNGGPSVLGGFGGNAVGAGVIAGTIAGGGYSGNPHLAWDHFTAIGGGLANQAGTNDGNPDNQRYATVAGGWSNAARGSASFIGSGIYNLAEGTQAVVGGGWQNSAPGYEAFIGDGYNNVAAGSQAVIGGGANNAAAGASAVILGGQGNAASGFQSTMGGGSANLASGYQSFIGGGQSNRATADWGTIVGGISNTVSTRQGFIGAGQGNTASGDGSVVVGGQINTASANIATVGGGTGNAAGSQGATVPGGMDNNAAGYTSFAAGRQAKALHDGAFVWADSKGFNFASTVKDQFNVRATGGGRIVSAIDGAGNPTAGVTLAAGSGSWASLSDRDAKRDVSAVDPRMVLEVLADVPIGTWSYNAQDPGVRHMGPMAQDFFAAFGLGEDERHISGVDADGVALAAIQGLHIELQEKDARIAALEARLLALETTFAVR